MGALIGTVIGAGALFKAVDTAAPAVVGAARNATPSSPRIYSRNELSAASRPVK